MNDMLIPERIDALEHKLDKIMGSDDLTGWKGFMTEFKEVKDRLDAVTNELQRGKISLAQRILGSIIIYVSIFILTTTGQATIGIASDVSIIASTFLWVLGTVILVGGRW